MHKVFIVDDEKWVIIGMKKLIEKSQLPFEVIGEANDGVTALEELNRQEPDVLFTDIRMPGYSGLELMEQMQKDNLDTRVVFISGYAEFDYAQKAVQLGADDYLLKPIEQEELNKVLERLDLEMKEELKEESIEETVGNEQPSFIQRIVMEIEESYTEDISLTELSERHGISIGHLSNLLKAELGLSFTEYLTSKRVEKAKKLLADETLSISHIAELVGYNDYFYFTKVFKKSVDISPSKYRKNVLGLR